MISALAFENTLDTMPVSPSDVSVLILDDSQFDRTRIRRMFENIGLSFHLCEVETLRGLEDQLDTQVFDIILIDYNLPQGDGFDALRCVQRHAKNAQTATVMIAGNDQSQVAVDAVKKGCKDYVAKGQLTSHRLRSLVLSIIENAEEEHECPNALQSQVDEITHRMRSGRTVALQPKIANIVSNIRNIRSRLEQPDSALAQELAVVEKRCLDLWASLMKSDVEMRKEPAPVLLN